VRKLFGDYRVAIETVVIVAVLVAIRAALWNFGLAGISTSPLTSSIVAGGVFVMGLVVAGTLSDYRDAERAPTDPAAGLYAFLRESESGRAPQVDPARLPHPARAVPALGQGGDHWSPTWAACPSP
jgi:hypothetical protein